jgi:hypothetical protein
MLTLLLVSSICAVGMGIVAMEYLDEVHAREASYMKYGVCVQIWGFMALFFLHFQYANELFIDFIPMLALLGGGIFMLGAISVIKAMPRARVAFGFLTVGIQICVITFLSMTTFLLP